MADWARWYRSFGRSFEVAVFSVVVQSDRLVEGEPFVGTGSGLARDRVTCENIGEDAVPVRRRGVCGRQDKVRVAGCS